ncbi:hypothetical protein [Phenylobacterium sp.]|uniref:hypothetical protein n=1 Tax=Phenylobacterium sp. TaxID=1871053 RepID=UPI0026002481|nr:hypothetical protein [Phenylobacterium sp.]
MPKPPASAPIPATPNVARLAAAPLDAWLSSYALGREAMTVWTGAYLAWADAATDLGCTCLNLWSQVAADQLANGGVRAPLLNDA